jgi:hypothetical protein
MVFLGDYFEWFAVPTNRRVKFVKLKLKGVVCALWGSVEEHMTRTHQPSIQDWAEMKARLEMKYLPVNYEQMVYENMLRLAQGFNIFVDQYIERLHDLTMRSQIIETDQQTLARYLKGLRGDMRKEMYTTSLFLVDEAYQLAL